jgi:hypothetical protein
MARNGANYTQSKLIHPQQRIDFQCTEILLILILKVNWFAKTNPINILIFNAPEFCKFLNSGNSGINSGSQGKVECINKKTHYTEILISAQWVVCNVIGYLDFGFPGLFNPDLVMERQCSDGMSLKRGIPRRSIFIISAM